MHGNIIEKKLDIDDEAKNKFEMLGKFILCKPKIVLGRIRTIDRTNISYIEPHQIIYKEGIINKDERHVIFNPPSLINPSEVNKAISNINKQMDKKQKNFIIHTKTTIRYSRF